MVKVLRQNIGVVLVSAATLFVITLFKDTLVDRYIVPQVQEKLKDVKYLRDTIKDGRFVTVEKEVEASTNHPIPVSALKTLRAEEYLTVEQLNKSENLSKLRSELEKLENIVRNLEAINMARVQGSFDVDVYVGEDSKERGLLLLNKDNALISYFLKDESSYEVASRGEKRKFTVRLQSLPVTDGSSQAPVGRMYRSDWDDFFKRKCCGISPATIFIHKPRVTE